MTDATRDTTKMTVSEFQQLEETNLPTELIDGEVVVSLAPKEIHQIILLNLLFRLRDILTTGKLRIAPSDVYLGENDGVQPDIFWVAPDNAECQVIEGYWYGPPTLVIEVISPSTGLRDRREKFRLYEESGVQEYWMVEPTLQLVEVYRLEDGKYRQVGIYGEGEMLTTPVLGEGQVALKGIFELSS